MQSTDLHAVNLEMLNTRSPRACYWCISRSAFFPRDAMLARVFATATCLSVCPSGRLSHAGIVPSRAKAGS